MLFSHLGHDSHLRVSPLAAPRPPGVYVSPTGGSLLQRKSHQPLLCSRLCPHMSYPLLWLMPLQPHGHPRASGPLHMPNALSGPLALRSLQGQPLPFFRSLATLGPHSGYPPSPALLFSRACTVGHRATCSLLAWELHWGLLSRVSMCLACCGHVVNKPMA